MPRKKRTPITYGGSKQKAWMGNGLMVQRYNKEMKKTNINSDNSTSPQNSFPASDAI